MDAWAQFCDLGGADMIMLVSPKSARAAQQGDEHAAGQCAGEAARIDDSGGAFCEPTAAGNLVLLGDRSSVQSVRSRKVAEMSVDRDEPHSPYSQPRDGYLSLGEAIRWVASARDTIEDTVTLAANWDDAEREVLEHLGRGALVAEGATANGAYVSIPFGKWPLASSQWVPNRPIVTYPDAHGGTYSGTLEVGTERWTGIRVRKEDVARLWPDVPPVRIATVRAETSCKKWLVHRMRASPELAPSPKTHFRNLARKDFPGLSDRAFQRAWDAAIAETDAKWSKAGRRKSPQAKS
jgi:hypothetical protein